MSPFCRTGGLLLALSAALARGQGPAAAIPPPPSFTPVPAPAVEASGPMVTAVELQLPPGSDSKLLADAPGLVAVRQGQRLSSRAVRRSIERLFATGRFADVVAREVTAPEGVKVIFEIHPKQQIAAVAVDGNRLFSDEEIRTTARLKNDAEYYPEKIEEAISAVEELYRRRGYQRAKVSVELQELGQAFELFVHVEENEPTRVGAVSVAGSPGLPLGKLLSALGIEVGQVLDREALEKGIERLRVLYRSERFYRARVFEPVIDDSPRGALLAVPVSAGPRYDFHLHGNRSFPDDVLLGVLGFDRSETLDRSLELKLAHRIESYYRFKGFHDARVEPEETRSPNGQQAVLGFNIIEGGPLYVHEVSFAGNVAFSSDELRELLTEFIRARTPVPEGDVHPTDDPNDLQGRTRDEGRPIEAVDPDPSTVFVEEAYVEAAEAMTSAYRDRGYLGAKVKLNGAELDVTGRHAVVHFSVAEGPRAIVSEVEYRGAPKETEGLAVFLVRRGIPFSYGNLEKARQLLTRSLGHSGHLFGRVEAVPEISADGTRVRVVFNVETGPQVRVGKVLVQGLNQTHERVIRSGIKVHEGDVLNPDALFDTQRNLAQLEIFRTVAVRLIAPDTVEATKDVVIELKERPRLTGEISGGYFFAEGPRVELNLTHPNGWGYGINLSGRLKVNYVGASAQVLWPRSVGGQLVLGDLHGLQLFGARANLAAQNRGLLPYNIGWRLDAIGEQLHRPYFRSSRLAGVPGLDWSTLLSAPGVDWAKLKISLGLQYELEFDSVSSVPGRPLPSLSNDRDRYRFPLGQFATQSVRFGPTFDLRDDPVDPHKGLLLALQAERTWDISAFDVFGQKLAIQTLKLSGNFTTYLPLGPRVVLATSLRAGKILALDPSSVTIAPKRFFLGGASSMRGFPEDGLVPADRREDLAREIQECQALANPGGCSDAAKNLIAGGEAVSEGGELFDLAKVELRFPAVGSFDMGVFFEAGNLWLSQPRFKPFDLRYVAGAGLRYDTPIGPLSLDLGVNLLPDPLTNESRFTPHFNIGLF